LIGIGAAAVLFRARVATAQGAKHPAILYMETVAKDLFAAQKDGTIVAYFKVITKHADLPAIGLYALGQYRSDLPRADYDRYFSGVARFMARYFADQTRKFRVAKAEFDQDPVEDDGDLLVRTKITLMSGSKYNVVFRLTPQKQGYKVSDVKVLGFSLTYLQRGIFLSFINKRGGSVSALVAALTR
jgi:ABC-type transporter MlaC component